MCDMDRRDFIKLGSVGAAGLGLTGAAVSSAAGELDATAFRKRTAEVGISMRNPRDDNSIVIQVNETWAAASGEDLSRRMVGAL